MSAAECINTIPPGLNPRESSFSAPLTWKGWLRDGLHLLKRESVRLFDILCAWQELRAQRAALGRLDERMLKDIGLSRADAERESAKPFWRP